MIQSLEGFIIRMSILNTDIKREAAVIIPGPNGLLLEGKMKLNLEHVAAPIAVIFHPHPLHGGTMHNPIVTIMSDTFKSFGCHTLRINYRGVGKSQGKASGGVQELDDALAALDWFIKKCEAKTTEALQIWVGGYSFGAWIAMQAAMRRPEISGFVAISPPINAYHFNMLTPCPNGIIIHGEIDHITSQSIVEQFVENEIVEQKGCTVECVVMPDADHLFSKKQEELRDEIDNFLLQYIK
jgi:alpha/beta superfamily hydrolase